MPNVNNTNLVDTIKFLVLPKIGKYDFLQYDHVSPQLLIVCSA